MKSKKLKAAIENQIRYEQSPMLGDITLQVSAQYVNAISFQPIDVRLIIQNTGIVFPEPRVDTDFLIEELRSIPTIDFSSINKIIASESYEKHDERLEIIFELLTQEYYAWMGKQLQQRRKVGDDFIDYPTSMFWMFQALDGEILQNHAFNRSQGSELLWLRIPRKRALLFDGDVWEELRNAYVISKLMNSSFDFEPFHPTAQEIARLFDCSKSKHIQCVVSYILETDLIDVSDLPDTPVWRY